ncbi:MAG: YciI family protein [Myxococcales bacterium]|nr:YciI family protein [Myxococcales bacterium]
MKYLALIYDAEDQGPTPGTPEFEAYMARWIAADKAFKDAGVLVGGEALEPSSTATRVRVRGGKTETMDGPFAETKEQLGGYYVFECENLDEAIKYAAMIPVDESGTLEVRPIMDLSHVG